MKFLPSFVMALLVLSLVCFGEQGHAAPSSASRSAPDGLQRVMIDIRGASKLAVPKARQLALHAYATARALQRQLGDEAQIIFLADDRELRLINDRQETPLRAKYRMRNLVFHTIASLPSSTEESFDLYCDFDGIPLEPEANRREVLAEGYLAPTTLEIKLSALNAPLHLGSVRAGSWSAQISPLSEDPEKAARSLQMLNVVAQEARFLALDYMPLRLEAFDMKVARALNLMEDPLLRAEILVDAIVKFRQPSLHSLADHLIRYWHPAALDQQLSDFLAGMINPTLRLIILQRLEKRLHKAMKISQLTPQAALSSTLARVQFDEDPEVASKARVVLSLLDCQSHLTD